MPCAASAGSTFSLSRRYWRSTMPWARAADLAEDLEGGEPVGPGGGGRAHLICSFSPATRISKNSSRLDC